MSSLYPLKGSGSRDAPGPLRSPAPGFWFLTPSSNERTGTLGQMAGFEQVQHESGAPCRARKEETKKYQFMSKGHRYQVKALCQEPKLKQFDQNKKHRIRA